MITLNSTVAKVLRDNEVNFCGLTYKVSDDEAKKLQQYIENMLNGKSTKVNAPTVVEEEKKPYVSNYDNACKGEGQFWKSDLVVVTLEDGKYRARFNYRLIKSMSKDKETHKYSDRKYQFMKDMFKKQITDLNGKWVSNDDEVDFGWYEFPTKKSAEEYRKIRKADDKKYEKKA